MAATITRSNPISIASGVGVSANYNASLPQAQRHTLRVWKVEWFNPAATTDTFSINEATSNAIRLQGKCEVAGQSQVFDFSAQPLVLSMSSDWNATVTSGTLYLWY